MAFAFATGICGLVGGCHASDSTHVLWQPTIGRAAELHEYLLWGTPGLKLSAWTAEVWHTVAHASDILHTFYCVNLSSWILATSTLTQRLDKLLIISV
mmetsp:Transcript_16498/g.29334  ORF Transcript_16498/g.29334 Transcript_16498/m.29334 type:complete len:98 (+) Transcript_16498:689-982(+)